MFRSSRQFSIVRRLHTSRVLYAPRVPFMLADIGEGITEVEVLQWFVKEGDVINQFDRVCEVQSDKATVEITSRYAGTITKLFYGKGDIAKVGKPLIDIDTNDVTEASAASMAAKSSAASSKSSSSSSTASTSSSSSTAPSAPSPANASLPSSGTKKVPFLLADIGEGITEVEILQLFVNKGDKIGQFDRVCEVQSDKATTEITSRYEGVVSNVFYKKGDIAKVGMPLIEIEVASADAPASAPVAVAEQASSSSTAASQIASPNSPSSSAGAIVNAKPLATPAVRRLAREKSIDLRSVTGSGPEGRILKTDLDRPSSAAPTTAAVAAAAAPSASVSAATVADGDRIVPVRGLMRTMIKTMEASLSVPHLGYCDEIIMDALINVRNRLKAPFAERGVKLTFMPFFIKSASLGMVKYPVLNSSLINNNTEVVYRKAHNIGIAMDTPQGLIVPNIKNCEEKSVFDIAKELNDLQSRAKEGKLSTADLTGDTFSLSNIGAIGGTYARPVIVPPKVAIGALGRMQTLPRFDAKGNVVPVNIINVSWSADHRVVDGAAIANFSNLMIKYLQNPETMLLDM